MNEFIAFLSINGDEYALTEVLETEDAISEKAKLLCSRRKVTDISATYHTDQLRKSIVSTCRLKQVTVLRPQLTSPNSCHSHKRG